ncbi:MAG TPA: response regulator, partial [Myxococcota bacterium]
MHKILIVEDESHLAEGLRFNLEAEGYAVEIAETGPAGERALNEASAPFGLVILDVMLPGMSGFELAQRIRAAGNFVPILILTAKD